MQLGTNSVDSFKLGSTAVDRVYLGSTLAWELSAGRTAVTVTAQGNAQISTAQSKFGGASAVFDNDGDYLTTNNNIGDLIGDSDYTAECWYRTNTSETYDKILDNRRNTFGNYGWSLYHTASNIFFSYRGTGSVTNAVITYAVSLTANVWYHLAVVKQANTLTLYLDGLAVGSVSIANTTYEDSGEQLWIGAGHELSNYVNGYIDEVRISNTARYTANFTPAATPFVNDANTLMLLHMDGTNGSTTFTDDNS